MKFMKTQEKHTQISVYCFDILKQLLPALKVNIIIVYLKCRQQLYIIIPYIIYYI